MSYRRRVVAATILRIFLVAGLLAVLVFSLLRVDSATYAQTESAPTLTATPAADAVELSWTEVSGATRYALYTWWDAAIGWQQIGGDSLTGTTYTHTEVTAGLTYYYAVRGMDAAGEAVSAWSEFPSATPLSGIAATVTATAAAGAVELSWTEVTGAARYELWVWDAANGWQQIGGDSLTDRTYTHTEVTAGVTYFYAVRGMDAAGIAVNVWSDFASAAPLPGTAATSTPTPTATAAPANTDREVLVALYNATDGPNWTTNTNWLSDKPLGEWHGVTTDGNGRVTGLELLENRLSGTLPSELGNLTNLTELKLPDNQLSGSIPSELGNLANLTHLWLYSNQLSGAIPPELGNLANLKELWLTFNQLSGAIPPELGNLANLTVLGLSFNQLSGAIPSELGNLVNLTYLRLADNRLTGCVPVSWQNVQNNDLNQLGLPFCSAQALVDRDVLVALYNATNGAGWTDKTNWLSDRPPGEWYGVTTDAYGRVTELDLYGNELSGSIPSELGNLANLTVLGLTFNQLSGEIPSELGNLANLTGLQLSSNLLSGAIPSELGNLANLTYLNLADNELSGEIPSELGNLANLTVLNLNSNQLSGEIPSELGNLANLTELLLSKNQLSGAIPSELGNLANLTRLSLWANRLSGSIPSELGNLANLTRLYLSHNQLSGEIPSELGNLANLTHLWLYSNQLTGCIPASWRNVQSNDLDRIGLHFCPAQALADRDVLVALYNATNGASWARNDNWLSDRPLGEWYGVTSDANGRVTELDLTQNGLSGPIPTELGDLVNLTYLHLADNQLTGCVPDTLQNVQDNDLNQLGLPSCSAQALADRGVLVAFYNATDGAGWTHKTNWLSDRPIGAWYGVTTDAYGRVTKLIIQLNDVSGAIPSELGNLANLTELWLYGNRLSGSIPSELGNLANLEHLELGLNLLSGTIPSELGNLANLTFLRLSSNKLSGTIPSELGNLANLTGLWLYGNNLSGTIPSELGNLANLTTLWLYNNELSGSIPSELGNLTNLTELLLYTNELSGAIPSELGNLSNLERLRLEENELSGPIPSELGNLTNLTELKISNNNLTGCVPAPLQNVVDNDLDQMNLPTCTT